MNREYSNLLQRQLRKHFGGVENVPSELRGFLDAVNDSYMHYEKDRELMDRANELSSQELLENNRQLSRKNEMLDAFVYRVSHDLKAPLNNVISLGSMLPELMGDSMESNPMVQRTVMNILDSAERMSVRIQDLLDLSRMESMLDVTAEEVNLPEMLATVLQDLDQEIQKSGAVIESDFSATPTLLGGRENVHSLLSNLLSNSIKYRSPERTPLIRVHTTREHDMTVLTVADNGLGIDLQKHADKLFGMFSRFHSHVPGSGVGLYIIKKIIEKSGGKILVDSTVGVGTTFIIHFPNARSKT